MGIGYWILGLVALALVTRLIAGNMDRDRIRRYIQERKGRVISIGWAPFGRGWFGEQDDRIYEVVYYDKDGLQHFATCKTSLHGGVYWTLDRVSHRKPAWFDRAPAENRPGQPILEAVDEPVEDAQAEELRRLREENRSLRKQLEGPAT